MMTSKQKQKQKKYSKLTVTSNGFDEDNRIIIFMGNESWGAPCAPYLQKKGETEEDMWSKGFVKVEDAMWGDKHIWVEANEVVHWALTVK